MQQPREFDPLFTFDGSQAQAGACPRARSWAARCAGKMAILLSNPALKTPSDGLCLWCPFVAGSLSRQGLWAWSCCLSPSFPGLVNSQKEAAHLPQLPAILEGTGAHMHKSKLLDLELPQAQEDLGEAQDWGVGRRRRPRSALWVPSVQGSLLGRRDLRYGFGPSTIPPAGVSPSWSLR